jgi:hypothetical protein
MTNARSYFEVPLDVIRLIFCFKKTDYVFQRPKAASFKHNSRENVHRSRVSLTAP